MSQTRLKLAIGELMDLDVQIRASFAFEKLKLGFDAFERQAVNFFQITQGSEIVARVKMPEVYDVNLDIDFLSISTCSCASNELCEHMAAVFFAVYQMHNQSPEGFMEQVGKAHEELQAAQMLQAAKVKKAQEKQALEKIQQEHLLQALQAITAPTPIPDKQPAKQAPSHRKNAYVFTREETSQVDVWHRYFQQRYEQDKTSPAHSGDADEIVQMLCSVAVSWEPTLRELFEIHARLFTLLMLEDRYHTIHRSHMYFLYESHLEEMVFTCLDDIAELIADISFEKMTDTYRNILEATAQYLEQEFYYKSFEFIDTYALYHMFWTKLLAIEPLMQHEKNRLDLALQKPQQEPIRQFNIHARAYHDWLDGQDASATERLQDLNMLDIPHILNQLGHLYEDNAWSRLHYWLRWLLPFMQSHDYEEVEAYIFLWRQLNKAKHLEAEFLETMAVLLPHSESYYGQYLLSKGYYQRWVDLQMAVNQLPIYLETYDLKKVENANPAFLLPLYHQAIEACISEKNRDGYETAVDMLKTLRKLYKRLNQIHKWDVYIGYTVKKYSRLRSFQQELRRGKIIS